MTRKDIRALFSTDKAFEDFEKKFHLSPRVKILQELIQDNQRAFRIIQAQQLQSKLYKIEYEAAKTLIEEAARERGEKVNLFRTSIPKGEIDYIFNLGICLDVISDCAETFLIEIDDILKKYDKGYSYEDFNGVKEALAKVREQLSVFNKNVDYRKYAAWGEVCDELIDGIKERVKKIERMTEEERECGKE